ncbi:uncharacterized protein METZ01_LOCUS204027, partial [marine metagenome]
VDFHDIAELHSDGQTRLKLQCVRESVRVYLNECSQQRMLVAAATKDDLKS